MSQARYRVVVVTDPEELDSHVPAWWELHTNRLEDNVCTSPAYLGEIYRHYGATHRRGLAFVYRSTPGADTMVACAPLGHAGGAMPGVLHTCDNDFVATATPLLHREYADGAVGGLCEWLARPLHSWSMVCWSRLGLESAGWQVLSRHLRERGHRSWIRRQFDRPAVRRRASFVEYLGSMSSKRRTAWRADRRRLEMAGDVAVRLHRNLHDYDLLRRFLALEARGWKGDGGTALTCSERDTAFFSAVTRNLADRNQLYFVEILVDGEPISITANFVDGQTVYGFKIANDPQRRRLAPGVNNLMELTRLLHRDPLLRAADSGSEERSFAAPLWRDPVCMGNVLVATRGVAADAVLRVLPLARRSRQRARAVWSHWRRPAA